MHGDTTMPSPWRLGGRQVKHQEGVRPCVPHLAKRTADRDGDAAEQPAKRARVGQFHILQPPNTAPASSVAIDDSGGTGAMSHTTQARDGDTTELSAPMHVDQILKDNMVSPKTVWPGHRPRPKHYDTCTGARARTSASNKPALTGYSRRDLEHSLPGGQASGGARHVLDQGLWSVRSEKILRKAWSEADEEQLVGGICDAEVEAWSTMHTIYSIEPPDLFRYGLRIGEDSSAFWTSLLLLLPHPFWEQQDVECPQSEEGRTRGSASVALLRYVLQLTVQTRLEKVHGVTHVMPKGPSGMRHEAPSFLAWLGETGQDDAATLAAMSEWRYRVWVESVDRVKDTFWRYLHHELGHCHPNPDSAVRISVMEQFEFRVTVIDLHIIRAVLDTMYTHSSAFAQTRHERQALAAHVTTASFLADYRQARNRDRLGKGDRNALIKAKRLAVVAERREATIRLLMLQAGDRHRLPDIPPYDRDPLFPLWPESGSEAANLAIERVPPSLGTRKWLLESPTRRALAPRTNSTVRDMFWKNNMIISAKLHLDRSLYQPGMDDPFDSFRRHTVPRCGLLFEGAAQLPPEPARPQAEERGRGPDYSPMAGLLCSMSQDGMVLRRAFHHPQTHFWV